MTFLRRGQITVEGPFSDTGDTVVAVTGITMTDDPSSEVSQDASVPSCSETTLVASCAYLIAGPPAMVEGVVGTLRAAGVPEAQLRPEAFSGY